MNTKNQPKIILLAGVLLAVAILPIVYAETISVDIDGDGVTDFETECLVECPDFTATSEDNVAMETVAVDIDGDGVTDFETSIFPEIIEETQQTTTSSSATADSNETCQKVAASEDIDGDGCADKILTLVSQATVDPVEHCAGIPLDEIENLDEQSCNVDTTGSSEPEGDCAGLAEGEAGYGEGCPAL